MKFVDADPTLSITCPHPYGGRAVGLTKLRPVDRVPIAGYSQQHAPHMLEGYQHSVLAMKMRVFDRAGGKPEGVVGRN